MKVVLFGATGMIGQGVLRECLLDEGVESVLSVTRRPGAVSHGKLRQVVHEDFLDFEPLAAQLRGLDACLFCLGVSSVGMSEADYTRVTRDVALAAARVLLRESPGLTFVFISGAGTDAQGRAMWARVKGQTEQALMAMPFSAVYAVRPGFIQPLHGIVSRTRWTRLLYAVLSPLTPLLKLLLPGMITTTEQLGRVMIDLARRGGDQRILEARDIAAARP